MEIRRLVTAEERLAAYNISAVAFHERIQDPEAARAEAAASTDEDWGAFTEDGKLAAHIINNHFRCRFDRGIVMAGGIGAVSTLPEYREEGCIRQIFSALLPAARARGEVISTLYPFSRAFYRKMGYETVCAKAVYEFPPQTMQPYKYTGPVVPYRQGASILTDRRYLGTYCEFSRHFNCMLYRSLDDMRKKLDKCGPGTGVYAYMLDDAYLICADRGAELEVTDCAWMSPAGFNALLGFLSRFSADYARIKLTLPNGVELLNLIRSPGDCDIKKTTSPVFMVRIMNTEEALKCMYVPCGGFTVKVTDEWLPENCGTWLVTGSGAVRTDSEPDLEVDIRALAQLALGAVSLYEAELAPGTQVNSNRTALESVFVRKPIFIADHY